MTSKLRGTLVVGQSGGPTAVINCSLVGVLQEADKHAEIENVYGMVHGIEGLLQENLIDLTGERAEAIQGLLHVPASALGSCRHKVTPPDCERILEVFRAHNVRYFIYIGGNDSMDTAHKVGDLAHQEGYELRVMGVPKTVDNDLALTDHCPGYGSAARFLALATMDTGRDLEAMRTFEDVTVFEAMGRNAGWLAAATTLGKMDEQDAPHLVCVPERPFSAEKFLADVGAIHRELGWVFAVVCQGIQDEEGEIVGASAASMGVDAFGHRMMGHTAGVASYLKELVAENLGVRSRVLRPSLIGRCFMSCVSPTDQEEAYLVGRTAVRCAVTGESGYMVTLVREPGPDYGCTTGLAPLNEVANEERLLPDEYINAQGNFVTDGFREYALPLLGGPLPTYARLERISVPKRTKRSHAI